MDLPSATLDKAVKTKALAWPAYDLLATMRRSQVDGAVATPADTERLTTLLGHPPRSYGDFAREMARSWHA